jgi:hypothetical protein
MNQEALMKKVSAVHAEANSMLVLFGLNERKEPRAASLRRQR